MSNPYLIKAVTLAKGQVALATRLRKLMPERKNPLTQAHIWNWLNSMKGLTPPGEYVIPIVIAVNGEVTPHELRPDLYPDAGWMPEEVRIKVEAA